MGEEVFFRNRNGHKLWGEFSGNPAPDGPLVVLAHGLAQQSEHPIITGLEQALNGEGIATVRFDFAGHGKSEGDFADTTLSGGVEDTVLVLRVLKEIGYQHLGFAGFSYGGAVGLRVAAQYPLKAAALVSAVPDYKEPIKRYVRFTQGSKAFANWQETGMGDYVVDPTVVERETRPLRFSFYTDAEQQVFTPEHAQQLQCPVHLIHGRRDPLVRAAQIEALQGKPRITLDVIPGADHSYSNGTRDQMMQSAVGFLMKYLKPS
ncbi:alpha/beta fold hydrolase [Candidatus Woesearchaeota archaeon]|nr:alpha/beta fold hydrolase [Candidatus Woesearchaeota archaeon]